VEGEDRDLEVQNPSSKSSSVMVAASLISALQRIICSLTTLLHNHAANPLHLHNSSTIACYRPTLSSSTLTLTFVGNPYSLCLLISGKRGKGYN